MLREGVCPCLAVLRPSGRGVLVRSCGSNTFEDGKGSLYSSLFLGLCTASWSLLFDEFVDDKDLLEGLWHDVPIEAKRGFDVASFGVVSLFLAADAVFLSSPGAPIDVVGGCR